MSRLMFNLRQGASLSKHNYDTTMLPVSNLRFQHQRDLPSSTTDEEETLPTVQYSTQPPEFGEHISVPRLEQAMELKPMPAIEEVPRVVDDH